MFLSKFLRKMANLFIWTPFWEVKGDTRPWLMARWKARGRLCIRVNLTFFAILRFRSYKAKCVHLGCSHRCRPRCTQILPGQGRPPSTILGVRKLETLGYPTVKTAFFCVPSFWHSTGVWPTDVRIGRSIYTSTKASFAVRCKKLPKFHLGVHRLTYRLTSTSVRIDQEQLQ